MDRISVATRRFVRPYRFSYTEVAEGSAGQVLVRDQRVNILLAGRDTTARLMSWAFRLLVRYPAVLTHLRREVVAVLGDERDVTGAHIRSMPYLQCVLNETLRLYPPVPVNFRFATRTTVLPRGEGQDGCSPVLLRCSMDIAYSVYHMHRRKDLHGEDANTFRPERWEQSQLADVKMGYLPFNTGPRTCLGKDLALMELCTKTASLLPCLFASPDEDALFLFRVAVEYFIKRSSFWFGYSREHRSDKLFLHVPTSYWRSWKASHWSATKRSSRSNLPKRYEPEGFAVLSIPQVQVDT
jgi:hypothetical protein